MRELPSEVSYNFFMDYDVYIVAVTCLFQRFLTLNKLTVFKLS